MVKDNHLPIINDGYGLVKKLTNVYVSVILLINTTSKVGGDWIGLIYQRLAALVPGG